MSSKSDKEWPLSKRMKDYEMEETETYFSPDKPLICRVDGRGFSKLCKNFIKPYDKDFATAMKNTAKFLLTHTLADLCYHQSDEISLYFKPGNRIFKGKKSKMISITAGLSSSFLIKELLSIEDKKETVSKLIPHFDSRLYTLPSVAEVGNYFVWRQQDAKRNSVSMLAQSLFSHKVLQNKNKQDMLKMIDIDTEIDYEDMPDNFKYGTFFNKERIFYKSKKRNCLYIRNVVKEKTIKTFKFDMV